MKKFLCVLVCCCLVTFLLSCGTLQAKPIPSEFLIAAGDMYGCDIVFWLDGFGLCYNLGDAWENDLNACYITLEKSESEGHDLIFLNDGSEKHCLGELSYRESGFAYGCRYRIDTRSPHAQMHPASIPWDTLKADLTARNSALTETPGIVRSFDVENNIINVSTAGSAIEVTMGDHIVYLPKDSISEEVLSLRVAESSILTIWWDWGETVITRECFFRLLEQDYVGFAQGGYLLFDDKELFGYSELYMP